MRFFFGFPGEVVADGFHRLADGSLFLDLLATASEVILGFICGNLIGTFIGVSLWYSKTTMSIARPYITLLGAMPVFALAPLLIIWFGTGLFSKIVIATLSTVFVALTQAYTGASGVSTEHLRLMQTFGATRHQTFRKVVAPASIVWVLSAFRLNVGFAILGAFVGEFISSNMGIGHLILVAMGLFDTSLLLLGVFLLSAMAFVLDWLVQKLELPLRRAVVNYL